MTKKILKIALTIVICLTSFIGIISWIIMPRPPSDGSLEKRFYKHRAEIERIKIMMEEDTLMSRIASDFTWRTDSMAWPRPESEWGISKDRWQEYRDLFSIAGISHGTGRNEKSGEIHFIVYTWGLSIGGMSAGYVYCGAPRIGYSHSMYPCIEQKDSENRSDHDIHYRYKRIVGDWFLYYEES